MSNNVLALPDGSTISLIKPLIGFRPQIQKQLKKFPYEKNVFMMLRFRRANDRISDAIIEILRDAGLKGVRADHDEWSITGNVFNPVAVLYCCKYGIALFDKAEPNQAYSPNVTYELGMMQCLERECLILKKNSLPPIPFDLLSSLYQPYRGLPAIRTNVRVWLKKLGRGVLQPPSSEESKKETKLEQAAVKAASTIKKAAGRIKKKATIVASSDQVKASDFTWIIKSKAPKKWTVSWGLKVVNKGNKPSRYKVQVMFLDKKDFALDDQTGPTSKPVAPGKLFSYKAESTMTPELAERVQSVLATVSSIRR